MRFKDKFGYNYECDFDFENSNTLVLSGGAFKCVYFLGALFRMKHRYKNFRYYAGTSCGSIIASLLCIEYSPVEIFQLILKHIKDSKMSFFKLLEYIVNVLEEKFEEKNFDKNITFSQLEYKTGKQIAIVATNLSKFKEEIFSSSTHPNTSIITAIKMSCSLPFIFPISKFNNDIYSDGIFFDNFPIKLSKLFPKRKKIIAISTKSSHYDKRIVEYYKNSKVYKIILIPDKISKHFFVTLDDLFCMFISGYNFVDDNIFLEKQQKHRKRRNSF